MQRRREVPGLLAALADRRAEIRQEAARALEQLGEAKLVQAFQEAVERQCALPLTQLGDTRAILPLLTALKGGSICLDDASWDALLGWLEQPPPSGGNDGRRAMQQALKLRVGAYLRVIMATPATISVMNPRFNEEVQERQQREMRRQTQESLRATQGLIRFGQQRRLDLRRELSLILDKPAAQVGWYDWKESLLYHPELPRFGYETFDFAEEKELARRALRQKP